MDFHMVSPKSMNHEYLHGLWCQHVPWTSAWSLVAGQSTDINEALCCRTGQRHHRSSQQAQAQDTNTASRESWASDTYMVPSRNQAHGHQHGLRWLHRPLISAWPQVAAWATTWPLVATWVKDINTAPGYRRTIDLRVYELGNKSSQQVKISFVYFILLMEYLIS